MGVGDWDLHTTPAHVEFFMPFEIRRLECGAYHTIAYTEKAELYSWGDNEFGQLGLGATRFDPREDQNIPRQIPNLNGWEVQVIWRWCNLSAVHTL